MTLKAMLMLCGRCNLQAAWGAFALQSPSLVVTMTSIWACHLRSLSSCGPKSPDSETQTLRPGSRIRNPDPEGIKNTTFCTNGRVNQGHMLSFLKHQAAKLWRNSIDPKATMTSPHLWASAGGLWLWLPSWAQCFIVACKVWTHCDIVHIHSWIWGTQHRFCLRSLAFSGATRAQRAGIPVNMGCSIWACRPGLDGYLDARSKDSKSAQVCVGFLVASAYFVVLDLYLYTTYTLIQVRPLPWHQGCYRPLWSQPLWDPGWSSLGAVRCESLWSFQTCEAWEYVLQHLWWTHKVQTCRCECGAMPEWLCSWLECLKIHR